mmetsp:Transcript_10146/g.25039  ORF Transcript_10146/g.25039 Transcript_10146/m.25039 type:complete len:298 (+) Transcript_10146:1914-2807(+)
MLVPYADHNILRSDLEDEREVELDAIVPRGQVHRLLEGAPALAEHVPVPHPQRLVLAGGRGGGGELCLGDVAEEGGVVAAVEPVEGSRVELGGGAVLLLGEVDVSQVDPHVAQLPRGCLAELREDLLGLGEAARLGEDHGDAVCGVNVSRLLLEHLAVKVESAREVRGVLCGHCVAVRVVPIHGDPPGAVEVDIAENDIAEAVVGGVPDDLLELLLGVAEIVTCDVQLGEVGPGISVLGVDLESLNVPRRGELVVPLDLGNLAEPREAVRVVGALLEDAPIELVCIVVVVPVLPQSR